MFPKVGIPQNGWWKSWKTLFFNGWFGGFYPTIFGNILIRWSLILLPGGVASTIYLPGLLPRFPWPRAASIPLALQTSLGMAWLMAEIHGMVGFPPKDIHEKIGCSMIFTIHFGGKPPIFWKHPIYIQTKRVRMNPEFLRTFCGRNPQFLPFGIWKNAAFLTYVEAKHVLVSSLTSCILPNTSYHAGHWSWLWNHQISFGISHGGTDF